MKRTPTRFALAALAAALLFPSYAQAQDELERFVIQARDANVVSNADLRSAAVAIGAVDVPYASVERPELGANLIATQLTDLEAAELEATRPDLIIERDRRVIRNGVPPGGAGLIPWSPDRIDQRVGNDNAYFPAYLEACEGYRPFIYVCDTGVFSGHDEFTLAAPRVDFAGSYIPVLLNRTIPAFQDPYDHGTGVAACAVGQQTGAGRGPASIISAVCYPDPGLPGGGTFASFAADVIYWSLNEHLLRGLDEDPYNDASVLIFASSTANGPSVILDLAVERARLGGMTVVVSAGNNNMDAVTTSPAGAAGIATGDITLTVAASTIADARWAMSNYGPLVELFAPGDNVLCASSTGPNICLQRFGTSFSAGYVAGAAARILSRNPWATPGQVCNVLTSFNDPLYGPSGPFGAGVNGVPKLLYVNPNSVPSRFMSYGRWSQLHNLQLSNPEDDADADGLKNLLEYFLALDPNASDPVAARPEILMSGSGNGLEFCFRKARYVGHQLSFEVQISSNCVDWFPIPPDQIKEDATVPCEIEAQHMVTKIPDSGSIGNFVRLLLLGS